MNTDHPAAAICGNEQERRNYYNCIIGKVPPRMFTSWQVELLLSTAVDRLTVELLHKADAKTVLAMREEINLIKEQLPEVFTPAAGTPDYQQWQDAVAVKAHYFPELLTPEEKAITAQTAAPQPPKPEMLPAADRCYDDNPFAVCRAVFRANLAIGISAAAVAFSVAAMFIH